MLLISYGNTKFNRELPPRSSENIIFIQELPPKTVDVASLAKHLVYLTPKQQKEVIGDCLYPLVEKFEPWLTEKVTGMILELDKDTLLHLIESPEALKQMVKEAIKVLGDCYPQQTEPLEQEVCKFQVFFIPSKL